jgi:hypothetical protein
VSTSSRLGFARRHQVLTWSAAWAVTSVGLFNGDVFSSPRHGSLLLAFALGAAAWGVAGASSFAFGSDAKGVMVWVGAWSFAFLGGGAVMSRFDFGGLVAILAWAAAAWLGALASVASIGSQPHPTTWALVPGAWGSGFLVGGYVGLVAAYLGGGLAENLLPLGPARLELSIGWALGGALGGALAILPALAMRRVLNRFAVPTRR